MKLTKLHTIQRGDTIVEVLIAIGIVSLVLTSSFVLVRRNTQAVRGSQERSEATKIAQGQVEHLKSLAATDGKAKQGVFAPGTTTGFCFNVSTNPIASTALASPSDLPALNSDDFSRYDGACKMNTAGSNYSYNVAIFQSPDNTFTAHVRWAAARGGTNDEVVLTYRVYE